MEIGAHPYNVSGVREYVDIYEGRIALRIKSMVVTKEIISEDVRWHWCRLPKDVVAISPTRQPNRHTHIVPKSAAVNGAWVNIVPQTFYSRTVKQLCIEVLSPILDRDPWHAELGRVRFGCTSTLSTPVTLEFPLAWAYNPHICDGVEMADA